MGAQPDKPPPEKKAGSKEDIKRAAERQAARDKGSTRRTYNDRAMFPDDRSRRYDPADDR